MTHSQTTITGRTLVVSDPNKVMYPATGFTKRDVIRYYSGISKVLLPHLKNRALTLKRHPEGADQDYLHTKQSLSFRPRWMQVTRASNKTRHRTMAFCLVNDLPSLIWVTNLANLELHASLARHKNSEQPTAMVFDLDPCHGTDIVDCAQVALWLRALLERMGLESFPKTSGTKGLQLFVPLHTPVTFDETKTFSRTLASFVANTHPDRALTVMSKRLRNGKVLIDWSQNDHHKTTVSAYSLRALDHPSVSTPLTWRELETGLKTRCAEQFTFSPHQALKRVRKLGDLFKPVLTLKQRLPKDLSRVEPAKCVPASSNQPAGHAATQAWLPVQPSRPASPGFLSSRNPRKTG